MNSDARYLASELERLVALPLDSKLDLERWYSEADKVKRALKDEFPGFEPIHDFWHFMDDADIRKRDHAYRDHQHQLMSLYIAQLRDQPDA